MRIRKESFEYVLVFILDWTCDWVWEIQSLRAYLILEIVNSWRWDKKWRKHPLNMVWFRCSIGPIKSRRLNPRERIWDQKLEIVGNENKWWKYRRKRLNMFWFWCSSQLICTSGIWYGVIWWVRFGFDKIFFLFHVWGLRHWLSTLSGEAPKADSATLPKKKWIKSINATHKNYVYLICWWTLEVWAYFVASRSSAYQAVIIWCVASNGLVHFFTTSGATPGTDSM